MSTSSALPTSDADPAFRSLPGHWVLARMGKRVLRPGGQELTKQLLATLKISSADDVIEMAPGLGATARLTLARNPASYTAIERDSAAATTVQKFLSAPHQRCIIGQAQNTGLPDSSANVVYGEAMLTMQSVAQKTAIAREAFRLLRPGGRYGIHEIALTPGNISDPVKQTVLRDLSDAIRVGVRPQTISEWETILTNAGFEICSYQLRPLHLLEPRRLFQDEGIWRTLKFLFNALTHPAARQRILKMRSVFRRHATHLSAIMLVAQKPAA